MVSLGDESGEHISINIMPMLDIFSILILFLLMSFAKDPTNHEATRGIQIPNSMSLRSLDAIPEVIIHPDYIQITDKKLLLLKNGRLDKTKNLTQIERELFAEFLILAKSNPSPADSNLPSDLTLEVDGSIPYDSLKTVLLAAQQADFVKFKFIITKIRS